jgi:hypothetical protein
MARLARYLPAWRRSSRQIRSEPGAGGDVAALVEPGSPCCSSACRHCLGLERAWPGVDRANGAANPSTPKGRVRLHQAFRQSFVPTSSPWSLVYPHYFRPRTPELGRYIGIYDGGRLAAMAASA